MDIDCDGAQNCANNNDFQARRRCIDRADETQKQTAFQFNGKPLNANTDRYIVLNIDDDFNPTTQFGIRPLALTAVVCRGRLFFGFAGDTNPYRQSPCPCSCRS